MSFRLVRQALDGNMAANFSSQVAYPNAEFTPMQGVLWYRPTFLPAESEQAELGTNGRNRLQGLYQVDVFAPAGEGQKAAETAADAVVTAFKRGTNLPSGSLTVRLERAWREAAIEEADWYHVPVMVAWYAIAANA